MDIYLLVYVFLFERLYLATGLGNLIKSGIKKDRAAQIQTKVILVYRYSFYS